MDPGVPPVSVSIEATDPTATEPPVPLPTDRYAIDRGQFTISRAGGTTNGPLEIFYALGGTARNGVDYSSLSGRATIPAGSRSVVIDVLPIDDEQIEPSETVIAHLLLPPAPAPQPGSGSVGGSPTMPMPRPPYLLCSNVTATVTILDNGLGSSNLPPHLRIVAPVAGERFAAPADIEIRVETVDRDGYVPHVEFFAGRQRIGESTITFIRAPDPGTPILHTFTWKGVPEGEFLLTAVARDDAGGSATSAAVPVRVVTIPANAPVVTVEAVDAEAAEPTPLPPGMGMAIRPNTATFRITRTNSDLKTPLIIEHHFEGTARRGLDYVSPGPLIKIPHGAASVDVVVEAIDDDLEEGDETVVLVIDTAPCVGKSPVHCYAVGGTGSATAVIKDNDPNPSLPPRITLSAIDPIASEGTNRPAGRTGTFLVHRSGVTNEAVTVGLKVSGTATPGKDYDALPSSVTIPAGARNVRLVVTPVDDSEWEPVETVRLELLPAPVPTPRPIGWPAYLLGRSTRAVVLILDNDQPDPATGLCPDGLAHVALPVDSSTPCHVEVSDDLDLWVPWAAVTPVDGVAHFCDPDSSDPGAAAAPRFYRVVEGVSEVLP